MADMEGSRNARAENGRLGFPAAENSLGSPGIVARSASKRELDAINARGPADANGGVTRKVI